MDRVAKTRPKPVVSIEVLRPELAINEDALDSCLMEQPDLYYHVAEGYAQAVANRDAAKLNLEQATAEIDGELRRAAAAAEEKLTEVALQRRMTLMPRIQGLERELLELRADADKWQALKEAFQQRSFMLRELVAMLIARLGTLSLERSVTGAHRDLAEASHNAASNLRRNRGTRDAS